MEYNLLKKRALLENLHYLGDGKSWKNNSYTECENPNCRTHLGIVKTQHYAKKGWQQVYRTDLKAYELALRVRLGAPINTDTVHADNTEGASTQQLSVVQVHPYKQEKHKRQQQGSYVDLVQSLIYKLLPTNKQFVLDSELENLCLELEQLETPFNAFAEYLSPLSQAWIKNPYAYVKKRLLVLKEATPALVAELQHKEEQDKLYLKQLEDMKRNAVKGEVLDQKVQEVRRALGQ